MEFYLGKDSLIQMRHAISFSQTLSSKTGRLAIFHFVDFLDASFFHGCSENQFLNEGFYKLRSFDRANTVTKSRKNRICKWFNDSHFTKFFYNKALFNRTFSDFIKREWICTEDASQDDILHFVKVHKDIIVKPLTSSKGKGIHLLDKSMSDDEIYRHYICGGEKFIFEEKIIQHPDMQYKSKSVNTIRVITIVDRSGNVHILKAGLRCGVGDAITDNFSAGGAFYPLNLEGGFVEGYGEVNSSYDYSGIHPGTDIVMIGQQIPHWKEVLEIVTRAAKLVPQVRYVGWDVAVLPNGVELIEGNNGPGCTLLECIGERRGFYKEIMSYL